jgi:hypothetical protein
MSYDLFDHVSRFSVQETARDVKPERTGWRDLGISKRHREWGLSCPATDIDFILTEYSSNRAVAFVEYKNRHAKNVVPEKSSSLKTVVDMGNRLGIPVFAARYTEDYRWWIVHPLNDQARRYLPDVKYFMTELEWVKLLHRVRGVDVPSGTGLTQC